MADTIKTADFSDPLPRIVFTVDGEHFEAVRAIPLATLEALVDQAAAAEDDTTTARQRIQQMRDIVEKLLLPEPATRLLARLDDGERPITPRQLVRIFQWLTEQYTGRPTQPPQPSSDGSGDATSGTASTATASPRARTSSARKTPAKKTPAKKAASGTRVKSST